MSVDFSQIKNKWWYKPSYNSKSKVTEKEDMIHFSLRCSEFKKILNKVKRKTLIISHYGVCKFILNERLRNLDLIPYK